MTSTGGNSDGGTDRAVLAASILAEDERRRTEATSEEASSSQRRLLDWRPQFVRHARARRTPVDTSDTSTALAVRNVDFSYGHVQVLFDVNLDVRDRARSWPCSAPTAPASPRSSASCRACPRWTAAASSTAAARSRTRTPRTRVAGGIVQVPGGKAVFPTSVRRGEPARRRLHLHLGPTPVADQASTRSSSCSRSLRERIDQPAGTLSGGEQQMLALAKALLLEPDILCIDELSLGLAPVIVQDLIEVVEGLKEKGLTMVIVEQSLNVALAISRPGRLHGEGAGPLRGHRTGAAWSATTSPGPSSSAVRADDRGPAPRGGTSPSRSSSSASSPASPTRCSPQVSCSCTGRPG